MCFSWGVYWLYSCGKSDLNDLNQPNQAHLSMFCLFCIVALQEGTSTTPGVYRHPLQRSVKPKALNQGIWAILSVLATLSLTPLLGALLILVMYCNCNNMMKHDCKTCLLCILLFTVCCSLLFFATLLAVCLVCITIVMTVRLDTPLDRGLLLYDEKWTIKCSSIKSGVFPFTLDTLLEGCGVNCLLFTQIVA